MCFMFIELFKLITQIEFFLEMYLNLIQSKTISCPVYGQPQDHFLSSLWSKFPVQFTGNNNTIFCPVYV